MKIQMNVTTETAPPGRNVLTALLALLVSVSTFVLYLPALDNGFVNWDDTYYITDQLNRSPFDLEIFTGFFVSNWHPLTMLSYVVDYSIWGLAPHGYHLVNIIFHSLDTLLVFLTAFSLASRAGLSARGRLLASSVAALLFGMHPLHVESVAWVSERKDVLSAFFFLLCVLAYIGYAGADRRRGLLYVLSLLAFILALMSKPMAITLPLVLLIIDYYPLGRLDPGRLKRVILEKAPFFVLSALSAVLTVLAQKMAVASIEFIPLKMRLMVAARAYVHYLYKMVFPFDLIPYYPYPLTVDLLSVEYLGSLLGLASVTALAVFSARRSRVWLAVWLFYLVTLLPVIGIIQVGSQAMADRYTYIPSIGVFILAGSLAAVVLDRTRGRFSKTVFSLAAVAVLSAHVHLTTRQIGYWRDSVTLWTHEIETLSRMPELTGKRTVMVGGVEYEMVPRVVFAYFKRALAYKDAGEFSMSIQDLNRIVNDFNPDYAEAYFNRGFDYSELGEYKRAVEDYTRAITLKPGYREAYYNRGLAYERLGLKEMAEEDFRRGR